MSLSRDEMKPVHGPSNSDVEQPAFFSFIVSKTHAYRSQHVRVLNLRWKAEKVVTSVHNDNSLRLKALSFVSRKDSYTRNIPIRFGNWNLILFEPIVNPLKQMVRPTEDEYIFVVDSLTFLFDKPYCGLDDLGIVIGDFMQICFSPVMTRDYHLFRDLLSIVRDKCCTGLNNHCGRSICHIEHSR